MHVLQRQPELSIQDARVGKRHSLMALNLPRHMLWKVPLLPRAFLSGPLSMVPPGLHQTAYETAIMAINPANYLSVPGPLPRPTPPPGE